MQLIFKFTDILREIYENQLQTKMIEKNWMTLIKPKKLNIKVDEKNPNIATRVKKEEQSPIS